MAYITKTVDVDIDLDLDDVLDFIRRFKLTDKDRERLKVALRIVPGCPEADFYLPVDIAGCPHELIALGKLGEIIRHMGMVEAVEKLSQ